MGTCIGHRNLRYFVCFLFWTALHALFTAILSLLYFMIKSMDEYGFLSDRPTDDEEKEEKVEISEFMNAVQVANGISLIYSFAFFLMLGCFALSMHYQVMENVTTNEQIRKKWNAKNVGERKDQRIKGCDKFKYMYWSKLPVSRIQRYHELR